MKLKNIIFDFDGVIADSYQTVRELFAKENHLITEEVILNAFDGNTSLNLKNNDLKQ